MTANQIQYWALQETKRSARVKEQLQSDAQRETARANLAKEHETNRSNVARENETRRSNLASEMLQSRSIAETQRANLASEQEKSLHNRATEGIDLAKVHETARHNAEAESQARLNYAESVRSHTASELISSREADTHAKDANTRRMSAILNPLAQVGSSLIRTFS